MDVPDFAAQRKERHMNQCRSDRGKQPRMILRSKGKYGVCGSKFSAFLRNIFRPFAPRGFKDNCQSGSDFHFGVSGSRDYTSQLLKPPMWRNGRRNGLKIRSRENGVWVRIPSSAPPKVHFTTVNRRNSLFNQFRKFTHQSARI